MINKQWVEKYRPRKIDECILPKNLKEMFAGHVRNGFIPNMTLVGKPGTGKTTSALAMINEIGADYMVINGSMEGNIDTLRTKISDYASTVSFDGGRKYVIVDEADGMTHATQSALRAFIEQHSENCGFILTCNFQNKLIEALISRCPITEFTFPKNEYKALLKQAIVSVAKILKAEGVEFDGQILAEFVKRHYPEMRTTIGKLQNVVRDTGKLDSSVFHMDSEGSIDQLIEYLREKHFPNVRRWVAENSDIDFAYLSQILYKKADSFVEVKSIPDLVLILAKYDYQNGFVVNPEVNTVAMLTEIMIECNFSA